MQTVMPQKREHHFLSFLRDWQERFLCHETKRSASQSTVPCPSQTQLQVKTRGPSNFGILVWRQSELEKEEICQFLREMNQTLTTELLEFTRHNETLRNEVEMFHTLKTHHPSGMNRRRKRHAPNRVWRTQAFLRMHFFSLKKADLYLLHSLNILEKPILPRYFIGPVYRNVRSGWWQNNSIAKTRDTLTKQAPSNCLAPPNIKQTLESGWLFEILAIPWVCKASDAILSTWHWNHCC